MKSIVILTVAVIASVQAYSSGAPESVCQDMVPGHPVAPQKSTPPYTITTSTRAIKAGVPMEVVIKGKDSSSTIDGILLQARQGDKIVGKWTLSPKESFAKLLNCGAPGSAITHRKHDEKDVKSQLAFTWTPPAGLSGDIKFRATIAYNGAVFWVGVESAPVKVSA